MNIYYDNIIYNLQKSGGISRYWHELTAGFMADADCDMRFIERRGGCRNSFRAMLSIPYGRIIYEPSLPLAISRYTSLKIKAEEPSVFHSSYYRDAKGKNLVKIVTLHDFTYEYFSKGIRKFVHSTQKAHAARNADGIICISQNTKADLMRFYPDIPEDKLTVINNGVSADFAPSPLSRDEILAKHKLEDHKFTVFIGERSGYKNFYAAVMASALAGCHLLIIGGRDIDEDEKDVLEKYLKGKYKRFGFMPNSGLCELFTISHCLLYTSLYEGFGIPVLEAMRCGCPVVASYSSSLPEAAGDAGLLSKEMTPESFAALIGRLDDEKFRQDTVTKGFAHSANFSWEKCRTETKAFYQKIFSIKA